MKQSFTSWLFQLTLPMAIIALIVVGQSWEVYLVDGPNVRGYGYPTLMTLPGLHTSMAFDFYLKNILINLSVYWLTLAAIGYFIWREFNPRIPLIVKIPLWIIAAVIVLAFYYFVQFPNNELMWDVQYDYEVKSKWFYFIH